MLEEKKIEILYDHYKDTFENQKVYLKKRNNYTFIFLGLIGLLSFQMVNPIETSIISNSLIKENLGEVKIDFNNINSILTFALFWIVLMYYQINLLIDKTYKYIHEMESDLTKVIEPFEITREGKTYLDYYPWLSIIVQKVYTWIFPIMLLSLSIIKWFNEKSSTISPWRSGHFWFDTIFLYGIAITSLLYLSNKHFNDFRNAD